ncbi:MAG TPA: MarR family winged helix-turn-helix transcriptional regulator [Marmoricola sp.]|nr:MarR family winged helix-turn-helix transcriptional regulator [Marmoricola sp.]
MEDLPLVRLLSMALRTSLEQLHEELAKAGYPELRPTHGYALNAVARGEATASELAAGLGMTKQGAAKVLALLLEAGYVEQAVDPHDSRNRPVRLTRRGRAAVKASVRIQQAMQRRWEQHVAPADMDALVATLEKVVRAENGGELPPVRPGW